MELDNYEATSTFTSVTTQIVAHPAIRGFVDGLQKATFPSPPAIQATGLPAFTLAGLPPASACGPSLGTHILKPDPISTPECKTSKRNEQFSLGKGQFSPVNFVQIPLTHNSPFCILKTHKAVLINFLSIIINQSFTFPLEECVSCFEYNMAGQKTTRDKRIYIVS